MSADSGSCMTVVNQSMPVEGPRGSFAIRVVEESCAVVADREFDTEYLTDRKGRNLILLCFPRRGCRRSWIVQTNWGMNASW